MTTASLLSPGVISFQRTGLKPCKSYVSGFVQAKSALYTVVTRLTAVLQQRGSVKWVTPSFQRLRDSDPTQWNDYSRRAPRHQGLPDHAADVRRSRRPRRGGGGEGHQGDGDRESARSPTPEPDPDPALPPETEQEAAPVGRAQPVAAPGHASPAGPRPTPAAAFEDEEPF